ncbi:NADH dehydrogenase subunit 5 [Trichuris trichiura]|uniref:NADH:ubiquinone reductase (H(+)-translocating) n=1 Tax=Trichuris trichiura TaxID=36087 RepID=A0A077ZHZ2_TRITR|nr:NADH dehydrogenase subunit 5 [Trichuris trichiura]
MSIFIIYFSIFYISSDLSIHRFTVGIAVLAKRAQIPLHTAPTPVSSLVHSSTLVVAGTILCIKLNLLYFLPYAGYLTSLYSRLIALYEKDLKKILAYSTMSQIALVIFIICTNLKELMLIHIINHALAKALLFIRIGVFIIFMFGNQDSRLLCTNESLLPMLTTSIICLVIICGVIFTSSYYSKEYNLLYPLKEESVILLINIIIFMSFAYSIRLAYLLFYSFNNNIVNPKTLYPSLYINILFLPLALSNGWIFIHNYSLPINTTWIDNKNLVLIIPLILTIHFILFNPFLFFMHSLQLAMIDNVRYKHFPTIFPFLYKNYISCFYKNQKLRLNLNNNYPYWNSNKNSFLFKIYYYSYIYQCYKTSYMNAYTD